MGNVIELRSFTEEDGRSRRLVALSRPGDARRLVRSPALTELRALCAAADLGSITRAARVLQVSQPALSKRLRLLEGVAGTPLLQRSTRGVTLTLAGKRLYGAARRLLDEADVVDSLLRGFGHDARPVRLAVNPAIAESWLPEILVKLRVGRELPLSVELTTASCDVVRRMTIEGRCDLGLAALDPCSRSDDGLAETVIWTDELTVAVPAGHPWQDMDEIDPEELAATPIVRPEPGSSSGRILDAALAEIGLTQVAPIAEIGGTAAAIAIAIAIGAPVLLPATAARAHADDRLIVRPVRKLKLELAFALLAGSWFHDLAPPARMLAQHLLACRDPRALLHATEAAATA
jgi:DNA-binding transcriptional LysR family regulator